MESNERFKIQVQDQETGEVHTFETNDFMFLSFEGPEVTEWMMECAVVHYGPAIKHLTEEIMKVRDADKPAELS